MGSEENTDFFLLWHDDVKITPFFFLKSFLRLFVPLGFRHHIFVSFLKTRNISPNNIRPPIKI
jgi:hypothetical protein